MQVAFRQSENSLNAPGCFTMPSTVRWGQWRPKPRLHQEQCVQARLISPATRLPFKSAESASTTSPTNSCPGVPEQAVVAALEFKVGIADPAGQKRMSAKPSGRSGMAFSRSSTCPFSRCTETMNVVSNSIRRQPVESACLPTAPVSLSLRPGFRNQRVAHAIPRAAPAIMPPLLVRHE